MEDKYKIHDKWDLWYHSLTDNKWTKTSYKNIYSINNLIEYKTLISLLDIQHLQNGMYFLMRNNIFPNWEDPDNRCGGCLSYKVPCNDIKNIWNKLVEHCINENILDYTPDETLDIEDEELVSNSVEDTIKLNKCEINGLSISPKKEFNIIKIWIRNSDKKDDLKLDNINNIMKDENFIYKKHMIE